jgi:CheY-like chemotaxis protein
VNHPVIDILLVEDNPGDVLMIQEAFAEIQLAHHLHMVSTGELSLDFLYRRDVYENAPHPDLILLDLNLPGLSGLEVLEEIKEDRTLRIIPVITLTSSSNDRDVLQSYERAANCYIVKPGDFYSYIQVAEQIRSFWFDLVKRPPIKPS